MEVSYFEPLMGFEFTATVYFAVDGFFYYNCHPDNFSHPEQGIFNTIIYWEFMI